MIKKIIFFLSVLFLVASIYYGHENQYKTETILAIITALIGIITCFSAVKPQSQSIVIKGRSNKSTQAIKGNEKTEADQRIKATGDDNESNQKIV